MGAWLLIHLGLNLIHVNKRGRRWHIYASRNWSIIRPENVFTPVYENVFENAMGKSATILCWPICIIGLLINFIMLFHATQLFARLNSYQGEQATIVIFFLVCRVVGYMYGTMLYKKQISAV